MSDEAIKPQEEAVAEAVPMPEPSPEVVTKPNDVILIEEKVESAVNEWFNAVIHNSPASRDTAVFNYLSAAKKSLIDKMKEVFSGGAI